jgi:hypothetical protein
MPPLRPVENHRASTPWLSLARVENQVRRRVERSGNSTMFGDRVVINEGPETSYRAWERAAIALLQAYFSNASPTLIRERVDIMVEARPVTNDWQQ